MRSLLLMALLAMAAGPASAGTPLHASGAWFRYLLGSIPAGGYVTLANPGGTAVVLTGAASPACGSLMFHRTVSQGGMERMIGVAKIRVPAHSRFRFAPGGYHLMCMAPHMHPGQIVPVTFRAAGGASVTVRFAVEGANATAPAPAPAPMRMKMK